MFIDRGMCIMLFRIIHIALCTHILTEDTTRQYAIHIAIIEHIAVIDRTSMVAERFITPEVVSIIKMDVQLRTLRIELAIEETVMPPIQEATQQRHEM